MTVRSLKAKGFTLVEILIVVVILGILAAIVIPQFTSASESAKASSLVTQLQTLRSQLELYQLQHNGDYPSDDSDEFWAQLTEKTNIDGATEGGDVGTYDTDLATYGPYVQKEIVNPFTDTSAITAVATADLVDGDLASGADADTGWVYNQETGRIKASIATTKAGDVNLDENDGDVVLY